ncbi:cyclase-like protein 2 [Quercus suber]|uniref:Cyclase-like protein 2 n=1 Tax=Quercus suber TaxID=58331 RepID=A0AAW0KJV9_QUESU
MKMMMKDIKPLVHVLLLLLALSCSTSWVLTVAITSSSDAYPTLSDSECAGDIVPLRREVYGDGKIFDISFRYSEDMPVWGSDEGLGQFLWLRMSMKNGSLVNVSELKFIVHSGTHVDTPAHVFDNYFDAGFDADALDLDFPNGVALLVDVPRDKNITGLDYLAVTTYDDAIPAHLVFLDAREIVLVEGVKLDHVQPGIYSLHCLPLRLPKADGSPARCILIK